MVRLTAVEWHVVGRTNFHDGWNVDESLLCPVTREKIQNILLDWKMKRMSLMLRVSGSYDVHVDNDCL